MNRFSQFPTRRAGAHGVSSVAVMLLMLLLAFGQAPAIEVHAHAAGDVVHVHDGADRVPSFFGSEHAQPDDGDAASVEHVHETVPPSYTVPDLLAHDLGDPLLTCSQSPVVAVSRGIEPPAPPRRPPIAILG